MNTAKHERRSQVGCLAALVGYSALCAVTYYPHRGWQFGAAFGILAFVMIFLRVGWTVPLTITGVYFGSFFLDAPIKRGTVESQMVEAVCCILFGAAVGLGIGASLDQSIHKDRNLTSGDAPAADQRSVQHGATEDLESQE